MNIIEHALTFLLFASIITISQSAELSNNSDEPSPEGCYRLALMVPREIGRHETSNISFHVCGNLEICLKSENVLQDTHRFDLTDC